MNYEELKAAQAELDAIADAARRALSRLPEGSTMAKAATKALEAADGEAREIQPFIDALAQDQEGALDAHLERDRKRAKRQNPLRERLR